jgi:hypothetical protein
MLVYSLQKAAITEISALFWSLRIYFTRDVTLGTYHWYLVLLKNVRDKNQFTYLARQVFPEDSDGLYKAYQDATQRPHGYLVLDLSQDKEDRLRFRTIIFPSEYPPLIYAAVGYEKDKIKL